MDMGEAIKTPEAVKPEEYCDKKPATGNKWKARINQWGTLQNCTGTRLYANLRNENKQKIKAKEELNPCFVAKAKITQANWKLELCDPNTFPVQAHHLIPKNHLPTHGVCVWLAKDYAEDSIYQLAEDNCYDTDDVPNGYCLPYATPTSDWKAARSLDEPEASLEKQKTAFDMMRRTNRQLHQGSHASKPYEEPAAADEAGEEDFIHEEHPPYLEAINEMLDVVQNGAGAHIQTCKECKENGLKSLAPLKSIATHVHEISKITYARVKSNNIFVSEYAYKFYKK